MGALRIWKDLRYLEEPSATDEAIRTYKNRIANDPKNPAHYYKLGRAYQAKGRKLSAYNSYQSAIEIRPDFYPARHEIAGIYASIGKIGLAIREYVRVLKAKPALLEARYNLGLCYERSRQYAKATHTWEAYIDGESEKTWIADAKHHLEECRSRQAGA